VIEFRIDRANAGAVGRAELLFVLQARAPRFLRLIVGSDRDDVGRQPRLREELRRAEDVRIRRHGFVAAVVHVKVDVISAPLMPWIGEARRMSACS